MSLIISADERKAIMESKKIKFDNSPNEGLEIELTYKELFELLYHKELKSSLTMHMHSNGWLYCELCYDYYEFDKTVKMVLCGSTDEKEDSYDLIFLFIDLENVTVCGYPFSTKTSLKILETQREYEFSKKPIG